MQCINKKKKEAGFPPVAGREAVYQLDPEFFGKFKRSGLQRPEFPSHDSLGGILGVW